MYWHITLTEKCNSKCRYCYEKSINEFDNKLSKKFNFDFNVPADSEINLKKLKQFISQDKKPVIIFYGGEPLVNIEKLKQIIDCFADSKNIRFCMQTNAKLLNELPKEYTNKFSKILVSIDGNKQRTDFNRGQQTYELVLDNIKLIKKNDFQGEIIARMTIAQDCPDLFEQVKHLISQNLFNSVHWQIDAGFYEKDFQEEKFSKFVNDYNKSLTNLINFWIQELEKQNLLRLYPFLGILNKLLKKDKQTGLMCGAGYAGYAITTNSKITACPIMNNIKNFYSGDLDSKIPELKKFDCLNECKQCPVYEICGGRCLYWRKAKLWPNQGDELICKTIKHLINEIKRILPKINQLIVDKKINLLDLNYEKYFGPEIIP